MQIVFYSTFVYMKKNKNTHIKAAILDEISRAKTWRKSHQKTGTKTSLERWAKFECEPTLIVNPSCRHEITQFTNYLIQIIMETKNEVATKIAVENGKENAVEWVIPRCYLAELIEETAQTVANKVACNLGIEPGKINTLEFDWLKVAQETTKEGMIKEINSQLTTCNPAILDLFTNYRARRDEEKQATRKAKSEKKKGEKKVNDAFELLAKQFGISVDEARQRFLAIEK